MPGVPTSRACDACRVKKKKCDQTLPICSRCERLKIPCMGCGQIRFRFKPFENNHALDKKPPRTGRSYKNRNSPMRQRSVECDRPERAARKLTNEKSDSAGFSLVMPRTVSPFVFSRTLQYNGVLERHLMHRWLTRTSWCFFRIPEDRAFLEIHLPRAALENEYLRNGLQALAAADLVHSGQKAYLRPALEYYAKGTAGIRPHINKVQENNIIWIYTFSMLIAVFNFVLSPQSRMLDRLITVFDILLGASNMLLSCSDNFLSHIFASLHLTQIDIIDPETKTALERLTAVSLQIYVPVLSGERNNKGTTTTMLAGDSRVYQIAIAFIKCCFAEEAKSSIKNYCWSITAVVDPTLFILIKQSEPMALMVLLYFGVLLARMRKDPITTWWLESTNKNIVDEITQILQKTQIAQIPDGREALAWARRQVD